MKKKLIVFLAFLMLASSLTACSESNPETPDSTAQTPADGGTIAEETVAETEETEITDDLPEKSFGGEDYVILTRNCCEAHTNGVYIEELTGDVVNDAVYERNMELEERFDVKIVQPELGNDGEATLLNTSVVAGDDAYDIAIYHYRFLGTSAASGYLLDTTLTGYIGYDKPWWYANVNDAYSVGGHSYVLVGMYDLDNYYDNICTYFHKGLMTDLYPDEDLYSTVKEGRWTVDMLETLASGATMDTDGDGTMNPANDTFGYAQDNGYSFVYQFAWDQPVTQRDNAGYPVVVINTEKQAAIFDRMYQLLFASAPIIKTEGGEYRTPAFMEGRALFMIATLSTSIQLRDMEADFGILPIVKYDETQEKHYTHATANTSAVGIPINKNEAGMEKSAVILEAMASGGWKTVRPAVYDIALKSKYARDDTTYEMIDIVIEGRTADFAEIFDEWGLTYTLDMLARNDKLSWASHYASGHKKEEKLIEKAVKLFMALDEQANP